MVFCVIHLEPPDEPAEDEEVFVIVPGTAKAVMPVPLDALAQFLPLLEQAVGSAVRPRCPACHDAMLQVVVGPAPDDDLPQTG